MIKKIFTSLVLSGLATFGASAQLGMFNHLGADVSVGTTGIGIEVATPITDFVQMRAGVSFMPGFNFNANVDGTVDIRTSQGVRPESFDMDINGSLARTQGSVIFNVYPFGRVNSLYVAAGAYFGGKSIIKIKGHSDRVAELQEQGLLNQGWVEIGDYKVDFEDNGEIRGGLCVNSFRPYLGLGYGRPCPGGLLSFNVELGVQFMGKMKVCQGKNLEPIDISDLNNDDDWQKWMDKLSVYPVLKFTLAGKIF